MTKSELRQQKLDRIKNRNKEGLALPILSLGALSIAKAYEQQLKKYTHNPYLVVYKNGLSELSKQTIATLEKANQLACECGVDHFLFVEAQFYFFHKWFHKAPNLHNLATTTGKCPSVWRAREYSRLHNKGQKNLDVSSPIVMSEKVPREDLDRIQEKRLEELVQLYQKSRLDTLRIFGQSGFFDPKWVARIQREENER
jgi:hypothetical protein